MKINARSSLEKLSHYLFAFTIILNCHSIWSAVRGLRGFHYLVVALLGLSLMGCLAFGRIRKKDFRKASIIAVLVVIYLMIFWCLDSHRTNSYIRQTITLTICIFYCYTCSPSVHPKCGKTQTYKDALPFLYCYENLMLMIACISLFFWLFGSILGYIQPTGHVYSTWTGADTDKYVASYYSVYFETQSGRTSLLGVPYRNSAIFTEAPMASLNFSVALLIELFMKQRKSKRNLIILTIAIISTVSTTGYIVVIMSFFVKLFLKEEKKIVWLILKYFLVLIALILAAYSIQYLVDQKMGTSSGSIRMDDFVAGFKAWTHYPILGNGYGNYDAIKKYMSSFRSYNTGYSNSPMNILALGGVYLFSMYLIPAVVGISKMIKYKDWNSVSFHALFLMLFTITLIPFTDLTFIVFIIMGSYSDPYLIFGKKTFVKCISLY